MLDEQLDQLHTWGGTILDGIQLTCGSVLIYQDAQGYNRLSFNQTKWATYCRDLAVAAKARGMKVELWIGSIISNGSKNSTDPTLFIQDALNLKYQHLGQYMDGLSLDDERDCAPRGTVSEFRTWVRFVDAVAVALHRHNLTISAAVQAMFGIQPHQETSNATGACDRIPSRYAFQPEVVQLMQASLLDKWLIMDTYYFNTGRFYGALDWHVAHVPLQSLGMGLMNRADLDRDDDWVARFYALAHSHVRHLNLFMMPVDDVFWPYLQRWKTYCRHCGVQTLLGCFDMSIVCNDTDTTKEEEPTAIIDL